MLTSRDPTGPTVCAIRHRWDPKTGETETDQVIPIVVERTGDGEGDGEGDALSWKAVRLPARGDDDKGGDKDGEGGDAPKQGAKREGLRLTMQGTTYQQRTQWLVVDFRCDPDLEGTEGEWESVDEYLPPKAERGEDEKMKKVRRADKKKGGGGGADKSTPERQLKKDVAALIWEGYQRDSDPDGERDTLYLTWYTKYVCSAGADEPDPDSEPESRHWGFFTWFVILYVRLFRPFIFLDPRGQEALHLLTRSLGQRLPRGRGVPDSGVVDQLQPARGARVGPGAARRHDPRPALPDARLCAPRLHHAAEHGP